MTNETDSEDQRQMPGYGVVVSTRPLQRNNRSTKKRLFRRENLQNLVMTLKMLPR